MKVCGKCGSLNWHESCRCLVCSSAALHECDEESDQLRLRSALLLAYVVRPSALRDYSALLAVLQDVAPSLAKDALLMSAVQKSLPVAGTLQSGRLEVGYVRHVLTGGRYPYPDVVIGEVIEAYESVRLLASEGPKSFQEQDCCPSGEPSRSKGLAGTWDDSVSEDSLSPARGVAKTNAEVESAHVSEVTKRTLESSFTDSVHVKELWSLGVDNLLERLSSFKEAHDTDVVVGCNRGGCVEQIAGGEWYEGWLVLKNCKILLTSKVVGNLDLIDFIRGLSRVKANDSPASVMIVAERFNGDFSNALRDIQEESNLNIALIRAPGYGERRRHILKDLAVALDTKSPLAESWFSERPSIPVPYNRAVT